MFFPALPVPSKAGLGSSAGGVEGQAESTALKAIGGCPWPGWQAS